MSALLVRSNLPGIDRLALDLRSMAGIPDAFAEVVGGSIAFVTDKARRSIGMPSPYKTIRVGDDWPADGSNPSIVVRCFADWGDFDQALTFLTPGGRGEWKNVKFTTSDSLRPDWILVLNQPNWRKVSLTFSPNRILYACGEPPIPFFRPLHAGGIAGARVLTCDDALAKPGDSSGRFICAPPILRTWSVRRSYDELKSAGVEEKPLRLSWITSNMGKLPGHRIRMAFLRRMARHVEFDLYGRGFRPVSDKWDALAPYRYSIAFENAFAPHYFSEKLMDCFVAQTMPLYFGSPAIAKYFPSGAVIVLDPDDPGVFDRINEIIRSDIYMENRPALEEAKSLVLDRYNCFNLVSDVVCNERSGPDPERPLLLEPVLNNFTKAF